MWPFSDFEYDFRSSQSTAYLLIVSSDQIAKALVVWSISTCRTWYTRSFLKGLTYWYSSQILMKFQVKYSELFCRFSITNSLKWFWIGGLCQNIQLVLVLQYLYLCSGFLIVGQQGGGRQGTSYDFLPPPIKTDTPNGKPPTPPTPSINQKL